MTVSATNAYSGPYAPNGVTTAFPFTFAVASADEVQVLLDGTVVSSAAYTVTLTNPNDAIHPGGTITFAVAPTGAELLIASDPDFAQDIAFTNAGPFLPESHDEANDRAAIRDIHLKDGLDRSLRAPVGEPLDELPAEELRSGKIAAFDDDGQPIALSDADVAAFGIPASVPRVATRTELAQTNNPVADMARVLTEAGREGTFKFMSAAAYLARYGVTLTAAVAADTQQGNHVAPSSDTTGASGAWVRVNPGSHWMVPEHFGAEGIGGNDTAALRGMAGLANAWGRAYVHFIPGRTYGLSHVGQETIHFQNLSGLTILGWGATIKTLNSGAPTSSLGYNWGQINIDNCENITVLGLVMDGNRANQAHTVGQPDGTGFNAGINFWPSAGAHTSKNVLIRGCRFKNHGVLSGLTDARGDSIIGKSGLSFAVIEDNDFEDSGRWVFALAEGTEASQHIYFRRNRVRQGTRGAGHIPWGAIDIEDEGLAHSHIYVEGNKFSGTSAVIIQGAAAVGAPFEVTVSDIHIRDNEWALPDGAGATSVPFILGDSNPGVTTYRTLQRLYIEDNIVRWAGQSMTFTVGQASKLVDAFIRNNTFAADTTSDVDRGLQFAQNGHIEGRIEITGNIFRNIGEAIKNVATWYADPTPQPLDLVIEDNIFENTYRAYHLDFTGCAAPALTSKVTFRGGYSRNSRGGVGAGEKVVAGALTIDYYGLNNRDLLWVHTGVTYRGFRDGDRGDVVVSNAGATLTVESATPADGTFDIAGNVSATGNVIGRGSSNSIGPQSGGGGNDTFLETDNGIATLWFRSWNGGPSSDGYILSNRGSYLAISHTTAGHLQIAGANVLNWTAAGVGIVGTVAVGAATVFSSAGVLQAAAVPAFAGGDVTSAGASLTLAIGNNTVTYAKMQDVSATSRFIGRITAGAGDPEELTGTQATTLLDAATTALKGLMSAQDKTRLDADWTWYRTILDSSGWLTAADAANTYGMPQGQKCAVTGTGTQYPLNTIYIAAADYPVIGTLNPKLRVRAEIHCNDAPPGVTFTVGLHPITRPATSGAAGLVTYTVGAAVASSTVAIATPAADSSNQGASADFAIPADGHYVIGVVTSGGALAASSHVHISARVQMRFA